MISIQDLMGLNLLPGFRLLTGNANISRIVSNVVVLEYESDTNDYTGFGEGDFVLTSLFFAKNNPDAILPCFQTLLERDISGIAVKAVYYKQLPQEVIRMAEKNKTPCFYI